MAKQKSNVANHAPLVLSCGPVVLDRLARTVTVAGKPAHLSPLVFRLLEILLLSPDRVWPRDELRAALWAEKDLEVTIGMVDVTMCYLRASLGDAREIIETVRGQGYRIRAAESEGSRKVLLPVDFCPAR